MTQDPRNGESDLDRTDELPVLSEDAIVQYGDSDIDTLVTTGEHDTTALHHLPPEFERPQSAPTNVAKGSADVLRLEQTVQDLNARWREMEAVLTANSEALTSLRTELADSRTELKDSHREQRRLLGELAERDVEIAEMRGKLETAEQSARSAGDQLGQLRKQITELDMALGSARQAGSDDAAALAEAHGRLAELEAALADAEQRSSGIAAENARLADELQASLKAREELQATAEAALASRDSAEPGATSDAGLLSKIAELEAYIAGRRDRWHEMEALVVDRDARIGELEQELSYRAARQDELVQQVSAEQASARQYRDRLSQLQLELEAEAKRETRVPEGTEQASTDHDSGHNKGAAIEERLDFAHARAQALHATLAASTEGDARQAPADAAASDSAAPAASSAAGENPPASDRWPKGTLIGLTSDTDPRHHIVNAETTIGRSSDCDIRIMTHFVSRVHAMILRTEEGVVLEDQNSTNGVFVNSVRVERAVLQDGDWVTIGETQFRFVSDTGVPE